MAIFQVIMFQYGLCIVIFYYFYIGVSRNIITQNILVHVLFMRIASGLVAVWRFLCASVWSIICCTNGYQWRLKRVFLFCSKTIIQYYRTTVIGVNKPWTEGYAPILHIMRYGVLAC